MAIWLDAFCNHDFPQAFGKKCAPRGVKLKPAQLIRASRSIRAARMGISCFFRRCFMTVFLFFLGCRNVQENNLTNSISASCCLFRFMFHILRCFAWICVASFSFSGLAVGGHLERQRKVLALEFRWNAHSGNCLSLRSLWNVMMDHWSHESLTDHESWWIPDHIADVYICSHSVFVS